MPMIQKPGFMWSVIGKAFLNGLARQDRLASERDRDEHLELVWRVFLDGISRDHR